MGMALSNTPRAALLRRSSSLSLRTEGNGVASMLAMMYLVLFAVLAVGFYASTGTSAQVSQNERRRAEALGAAESGMDYIRYQLAQVVIPPTATEATIINEIYNDLRVQIEGTGNMGSKKVGINGGTQKIDIPANANEYIQITSNGPKFHVQITKSTMQLVVKVTGCYSSTPKAIADKAAVELKYSFQERPTDFFSNGMAARGAVTIDTKNPIKGTPAAQAGILTTTNAIPPITMLTGSISGDLTILKGTTPVITPGTSVGGSSILTDILANHVDYIEPTNLPEFPSIDTSVYTKYATTAYVAGKPSYDNVFIPANMNPTIAGPITLRGVIYVKSPNNIKFSGNVNIQGIIVTDSAPVGTLLTNVLTFTGSGNTTSGLETLPDLPQFHELRQMGGSFVIAPGYDIKFTGNFNAINGNIVGDRINVQGSADLAVNGSMVALKNTLTLGTNGVLSFKPGTSAFHTGLRFSGRYIPEPNSYDEVKP